MRQRRPFSAAVNTDSSRRSSSSDDQATNLESIKFKSETFITVISGILSFILSTFILLLMLSYYYPIDNTSSDNMTYAVQLTALPHWEWHRYSGFSANHTQSSEVTQKRYLIVQIARSHISEQLPQRDSKSSTSTHTNNYNQQTFGVTSKVNRAYAKKWKIDYVKVTLPNIDAKNYEHGSIETKQYIGILRDVLKMRNNISRKSQDITNSKTLTNQTVPSYDMAWIFNDPSMMPVNFERSIFEHGNSLVTGISQNDSSEGYTMVNSNGGLLWNLKHPQISQVFNSWVSSNNLMYSLSSIGQASPLMPLWSEIPDDTTTIYHFPFEKSASVVLGYDDEQGQSLHQPTHFQVTTEAMIRLQSVADLVCFRYFPSCDVL